MAVIFQQHIPFMSDRELRNYLIYYIEKRISQGTIKHDV